MNSEKKLFWTVEEDGIYSHVEPVYLYDEDDKVPYGFYRNYSEAKKELIEKLRSRMEDFRGSLKSARSATKNEILKMWDSYARERAGL